MSRLRRLDKKLIDQHLNSDLPLDIDDQSFIVSQLTSSNRKSYNSNRLYFTILLLVQVPIIIVLNHLIRNLNLVIVLLSTTLTLVKLRRDDGVTRYLNYLNALICIPLVMSFITEIRFEKLYYLLPVVNLANLVLFRWWYSKTEKELEVLDGMKYKFKSV